MKIKNGQSRSNSFQNELKHYKKH